ncbi:MAG: hypothetical protein CL569_00955 [Alphaproteobacteria bacterium]|nr:hypothetical protein [Alphaproteobacteria bacterium]|tara:strand:- start:2298 stop:3245 length:948 start_codon:yes stop_codon:yes gene_type:complete
MSKAESQADVNQGPAPEPTRLPARGLLLLVLLTLIWGSNWPFAKVAVEEMPAIVMRGYSGTAGGALVLVLAVLAGQSLRLNATEWRWIFPTAFFNATLWLYMSGLSVSYISAGHTAVAAYTMPLWLFLISTVFLRETPSLGKWIGLLLGMGAIAVLFFRNLELAVGDWRGVAAMLVAACSWAVGTVLMKRVPWRAPTLVLVGWQFFLGGIPLTVLAVPAFMSMEPASVLAWSGATYSAFMGVSAAYWLWFKIVDMVPAWVASISVLAVPAVSLVIGAVVLGEPLGWMEILALLLIVGGVSTVLPRPGNDKAVSSR